MVNNIYIFDETVTRNGVNQGNGNRGNHIFAVIGEIKRNRDLKFPIYSYDQVYLLNKPQCNCNQRYDKDICKDHNCSEFRLVEENSIIFIHTSNQCFYGFTKQFIGNNNYWMVCYSGGGQVDAAAYNDLIKKHDSATNIAFFGLSPSATAEDIKRLWNLEAFITAIIEEKANPFDSLQSKGTPYLIALSILCQGYLAAKDPSKIKFTDKIDLKSKEIPPDWWNPAFGSGDLFENTDVSKEIKALGKEAPAGITGLFDSKINPTADLVLEAYNSLPEILKS